MCCINRPNSDAMATEPHLRKAGVFVGVAVLGWMPYSVHVTQPVFAAAAAAAALSS